MDPKVSIIILNWNGWEDTIECLESLYQTEYPHYDVILVDNASTDNSIKRIADYCEGNVQVNSEFLDYSKNNKPVQMLELNEKKIKSGKKINKEVYETFSNNKLILIKNTKNYGFAAGNNIAIKFSLKFIKPDYILLLNNDTIVRPNFLDELVSSAKKYDEIGIFSPKLLLANNPKIIDSTGHILKWGLIVDRGHNEKDTGQYDKKYDIMGAKAAASFYNAKMIEDIGLLNENYIITYEDAEFSWRAKKRSWKARYVPSSIVYHKSGKSIKKDKKKLSEINKISLRNSIITVKKHGNKKEKFQFLFSLIRSLLINIFLIILRKNSIKISDYVRIVIKNF